MPEITKSPFDYSEDLPEDRSSRLAAAKEQKLSSIAVEYKKATLESLYDVDSPTFSGVTGGVGGTDRDGTVYDRTDQLSADRLSGVDSYEVFPSDQRTQDYLANDPRGIAKMERQRSRLAESRGVEASQVTNEDVFEEGAKGTLKELALLQAYANGDPDYIQKVRNWTPSSEVTQQWRTSTPSFGSKENPLNIEVERAFSENYGYYGRPLSQVRGVGSEHLLGEEGAGYIYNEEYTPKPNPASDEEVLEFLQKREAEGMGFFDRAKHTASTFYRTLGKEVVVDFADWVGEGLDSATGGKVGWDVGTEEQKTAMVNSAFGVNPYVTEESYQTAKVHAKNIADAFYDEGKEVDLNDVYNLVKIGVTTPEMFADSAAFITGFFIPLLGWGGKAAKADKTVKGIKAAQKAGKLSKEAAEASIKGVKRDVVVLDKVKGFAQSNAGLMQISAGNVNDQIDAFRVEHGASPSVAKVAQMMATETILLGMERWADLSILKSPAALKGAREAFSTLAKNDKLKVMAKAVGVSAGLTANMGKEAGQEYLQEIGQEFNVKFNFDDNTGDFLSAETLNEAKEVFLAKDMQTAGILGAGLGAGGALQFAGAGALANTAAGLKRNNTPDVPPAGLNPEAPSQSAETDTERQAAKKAYGSLLVRLQKEVNEGKVNTTNIYTYLDEIDTLNETKHIISDATPEQIEAGENVYNSLVSSLVQFVNENPELKLSKRIVRQSVKDSLAAKEANNAASTLSAEATAAMQKLAGALGEGPEQTTDAVKTLNQVQEFFKEDYQATVVNDEEVLTPFINAVEKSLVGSVSADTETSFNVVKEALKTPKEATKDSTSDTVLGSAPETDTETEVDELSTEEVDYDDYTRAVDVERIMHIILSNAPPSGYGEDFIAKLTTLARTNNIEEDHINKVIKSYAAVEEEAVTGNRGYMSRISRIKGVLESSNPDMKVLHRERAALDNMTAAFERAVEALSRGIKDAENTAEEYNKTNIPFAKTKTIKTDYLKLNPKTGRAEVPFTIHVSKKDGKWQADTKEAKKRLATKQRHLKEVRVELTKLGSKASTKAPGAFDDFSSVKIPASLGKLKSERKKDETYLSNIGKILSKIGAPLTKANKVIIDDSASPKWQPNGEYRKANAPLVNSESYGKDDVVLVNTTSATRKGKRKNGKPFYVPDIAGSANTELTAAQENFNAAIDAGATIILDRELAQGHKGKTKAAANRRNTAQALRSYLVKKKGYTMLQGPNSTVFIKETEENKEAVSELRKSLSDARTLKTTLRKDKAKLVKLHRALAADIDPKTGEAFQEETKQELSTEYTELYAQVAEESFKGDEEKVARYLESESKKEVEDLGAEILSEDSPAPLNLEDKALEKAVEDYIETQEGLDKKGKEVLAEWKTVTEILQLQGKEREAAITNLVKAIGAAPKSLIKALLGSDRSFAAGKKDIYEVVYKNVRTGEVWYKPLRAAPSAKLLKDIQEGNTEVIRRGKHVPTEVRRVVQDASKIVNITKTTVVNSIPVDALPFTIREYSKKFTDNIFKALSVVSEAELSEQTDDKDSSGKFLANGFNLHNSPARGIIFNNEGKANPEVMTAMYLAVGELLTTDPSALQRGYKTDAEIAQMFNLQEHEVTPDMRAIANNNGALLKTVASKVGTTVMSQLGLSKKSDSDTASAEYEALVADIGNATILIAEQQGILEATKVPSNEIAKAFKEGEERAAPTDTHFIHVKDKEKKVGAFTNHVPTAAVEQFSEGFKLVIEDFPEAVTGRKEPSFRAHTSEQLAKATSKVRNDIIGLSIPAKAQKTIKHLMNTPFEYDSARIDAFLEAVDADGSQIKQLLGYVDLDSDKYKNLYYKDQEVQEVKNREIEKSIDELRRLKARVEVSGEADPVLYFNYSYVGNNRYMLDSNTVNPQNDKLHRFLFPPKGLNLNYTASKSSSGGLLFTTVDKNGENVDETYTVRYALAQAFGVSTDKVSADTIIDYTNVMLSLTSAQLQVVGKELLAKGEYEFTHEGKKYAIEAEHLSHTMHALDFLNSVKEGEKDGFKTPISSSISSEADSLTSGFANKVQQMPILADMDQHFARVGVFTEEFLEKLKDNPNFKDEGVPFDPDQGHTTADVLDAGEDIGFRDSYQNLAFIVISRLIEGKVQDENLSKSVRGNAGVSGIGLYEAIKPLLPGGNNLVTNSTPDRIEGIIRNLFKNPFMIFNYSASISRISKNLGFDVAHSVAKAVATADLTNTVEGEAVKQVADDLIQAAYIIDPDTGKRVKTAKRLQQLLKKQALKSIKIKAMPVVVNKTGKAPVASDLETALSHLVENTYGKVVAEVFEEQFAPFIEVQEAMNDAFKVAFRIFDKKRMDKLKTVRAANENRILTDEDHAKVLEELWDDFPWIVGPLTGANSKKDVIAVVSTSVREANNIIAARKNPQTPLGTELKASKGTTSRKVTPLIRYFEEAVSAGSVLPFHAIDGAEMSSMINELSLESILAVHDAIIVPNTQADEAGFHYQKGMADLNSQDYVLADALTGLIDRMAATIDSEGFSKDYSKLPIKGIKATSKEDTSFPVVARKVLNGLKHQTSIILDAREEYYGVGGKLEGAIYGNMVSTPGAMYKAGEDGPSTAYKQVFEPLYKATEVTLENEPQAPHQIEEAFKPLGKKLKTEILKSAKKAGFSTSTSNSLVTDLVNAYNAEDSKVGTLVKGLKTRIESIEDTPNGQLVAKVIAAIEGLEKESIDAEPLADLSTLEESEQDITSISEEIKKADNFKGC